MASDNTEVFRAMVDAISRGDLDAALKGLHPEAEFETLRSAVEGPYRGHDGAREFMRDNDETFELFEASYPDVEELPGARVIAIGTLRVRGRGGGVEVEVPTAVVAEFRDGRVWRLKDYGAADAARAAVG